MTTPFTYERRLGQLYERTKTLTVKEIAAQIRKVIRQTAKDQVLPPHWNYQVRYRTYAGGCAIDVNVGIPDELHELLQEFTTEHGFVRQLEHFPHLAEGKYEPLVELHKAEKLLQEIHRGYNYDGSDAMTDYFDVRYYGTVTLMPNTRYGMFFGKVK
jgi:hypothetical protein